MSRAILILGATSPIARAAAREFAARGDRLYVADIRLDEVQRVAADLRLRFDADVRAGAVDADCPHEHEDFFAAVVEQLGGLDGVLTAVGYMGDQTRARDDLAEITATVQRNFTGVATLLALAANHLEAKRSGFIAAIGSVAGDRGRASNYTYGAAKGGLGRFVEGLRHRLAPAGVRVVLVKPGFVDTEMTYGLDGLFLVASPDVVGRKIVSATQGGPTTLYVPGFWRWIMLIIQHLPGFIFHRSQL